MTTSMTAKDLDARFLQDALQDEAEVRQLYAYRPGRFAVQAATGLAGNGCDIG